MGKWLKTNDKGLIVSAGDTKYALTDEGNGFYSLNGEDAPPFNLYFDNPPGLYFLDTTREPSESGAYTAKVDVGNEAVPFTDVSGSEPYETSGYSYSAEFYDGSILSGYFETYESKDGQTLYDFYSGESASNQVYIGNLNAVEITEGVVPSIPRIFSIRSTREEEYPGDIQLRSSANSGNEMLTRIVQQDEELTYYDFIDGDGYYCFNGGIYYNGKYVYKNEEKDVYYAAPMGSSSATLYKRTAKMIYKGENTSTKYYLVGNILCKKYSTHDNLDEVSAYTVDNSNVICNYCAISTSENFLTDTYPSVKYNELNKKVIFNPPFPKLEFSGSASETQVLETKAWSDLKINYGIYKRYADFIMFEKHNRLDFNVKINGEYPSNRAVETSSNVERIIFNLYGGTNESFSVIIDAISKTVEFSYHKVLINDN